MVGDLATAQGNVTLRYPEALPLSFRKTHEFEIGVSDQMPSGFESLGGGRWRPFIYTEAQVKVTLELSTRFGNIIVEHLVE